MPLFGADSDSDDESAISQESSFLPEPSFAYKPSNKKPLQPASGSEEDASTHSEDEEDEELPPVEQLDESEVDESSSLDEGVSSPSVQSPPPMPPLPVTNNVYARKSLAELAKQDPSRNRVMQASIFSSSRKSLNLPLKTPTAPAAATTRSMPAPTVAPVSTSKAETQKMPGPLQRKHRKLTRTSTAQTVVKEEQSVSLALGRSYRTGWGPDGKLAAWGDLRQNRCVSSTL
jgi:hypothetical protein